MHLSVQRREVHGMVLTECLTWQDDTTADEVTVTIQSANSEDPKQREVFLEGDLSQIESEFPLRLALVLNSAPRNKSLEAGKTMHVRDSACEAHSVNHRPRDNQRCWLLPGFATQRNGDGSVKAHS